jgi:hypothetical protein
MTDKKKPKKLSDKEIMNSLKGMARVEKAGKKIKAKKKK